MTHHDTRYRDLFSHVEMVRALFGGILQACVGDTVSPPGVESFDWDRAQMLHSGFVSETLEQRHSDCIWRLLYRSTDMNLDPEPDSESGSDSDSDSDSDTDTDTDTDIGTGTGTGTGTVNTLVLALLSFIADLKPDTVIFAMEEPEIAVPPHTQRRIAQYLLTKTTQAFVTSHSPFVIEKFEPSKTLLLSRDGGMVSACKVSDATGLKDNDYKRFSRAGLSECMLGRAAIVVEGVTELHAMPIVARRMEENDPNLQPLDIAGVAFFDADGESNMPKFGKFFRTLGLRTFAFYDLDYKKKRKAEQAQALADNFEINVEHAYKGFEDLLVAEVPVDRLWSFLAGLKENNEHGNIAIPDERPSDDAVKAIAKESLGGNKGAGWSARLLEECEFDQLPATVTQFLASVFALFPPPPPIYEDGGDNSDLLA